MTMNLKWVVNSASHTLPSWFILFDSPNQLFHTLFFLHTPHPHSPGDLASYLNEESEALREEFHKLPTC